MEDASISWLVDENSNLTIVDKSAEWLKQYRVEITTAPLKTEKRKVNGFSIRTCFEGLRAMFSSDGSDDVGMDNVRAWLFPCALLCAVGDESCHM